MARKEWIADVPTAIDTAGAYSPSGVPTTGDDVILNATHVGDCLDGSVAVTCDTWRVAPGFTGDSGTAANPLRVNADRLTYESGSASNEAHFTSTLDQLICRHRGTGASAFQITPTLASSSEEWMLLQSGRCKVLGGSLPSVILKSTFQQAPIFLDVDTGVSFGQEVIMFDGDFESDDLPTTAIIMVGGVMRFTNGGTLGALRQFGGSIIMSGGTALTINEADIAGGIFDCSAVRAAITLNGRLLVGTNAFVNLDNGESITPGTVLVLPGGQYRDHANSGSAERF